MIHFFLRWKGLKFLEQLKTAKYRIMPCLIIRTREKVLSIPGTLVYVCKDFLHKQQWLE